MQMISGGFSIDRTKFGKTESTYCALALAPQSDALVGVADLSKNSRVHFQECAIWRARESLDVAQERGRCVSIPESASPSAQLLG